MQKDHQAPHTQQSAPSGKPLSKKRGPQSTYKERQQRNAKTGYPTTAALRRTGAKRKPYRNTSHRKQALAIGKAYKGGDERQITKEELVLARTVVPAQHFDAEPDLMETAFVPYRLMSPYKRTQEFGRIFDELYREYRKRYWAKDTWLRPRLFLHSWPDGDIVALWQARQHADVLGLPYRYFLRQAFEHCFAAGYKRCPTPNQIWRDPVVEAVESAAKKGVERAAFEEYRPGALHPMFLAENYRGYPVQVAAHDDLVAKIKQFPATFKLGSILVNDKTMPESIARERFGDAQVDKVLNEYRPFNPRTLGEPMPHDEAPQPGCFGAHRAASVVCQKCPVVESCQTLHADIGATLTARYGSEAPRASKQTSDATERKRRQRERERLDRAAGRQAGPEDGLKQG